MSFHSQLVRVLPTDLVAAGVCSSTQQVYFGRRPQKVTRLDLEVWVEQVSDEDSGTWQAVFQHTYHCHVRRRSNAGGDSTGLEQLTSVESRVWDGQNYYYGQIRMLPTFPKMLPATAKVLKRDSDPSQEDVMEGVFEVVFMEKE